jgi:hypothetical protein
MKRLPASDRAYPKIPHCRRGKWHHHGGDVCGLVVFGLTVLSILFLLHTGREFFVPAQTLIGVKLSTNNNIAWLNFLWTITCNMVV